MTKETVVLIHQAEVFGETHVTGGYDKVFVPTYLGMAMAQLEFADSGIRDTHGRRLFISQKRQP